MLFRVFPKEVLLRFHRLLSPARIARVKGPVAKSRRRPHFGCIFYFVVVGGNG